MSPDLSHALILFWRHVGNTSKFLVVLSVLGSTWACRSEVAHDGITRSQDLPICEVSDGYTDKPSYTPGAIVKLYANGSEASQTCRLELTKLSGTLVLAAEVTILKQADQPVSSSKEGFKYAESAEIVLPNDLHSGVYLLAQKIPVFVKPKLPAEILVLYPSNTANAYSTAGGKSLYSEDDRPSAVSFLRPIALQRHAQGCLRWLENLSEFQTGVVVDSDLEDEALLSGTRVLLIVGHSEYWTRTARRNFDKFIASGGHAVILSGNTMWWQVRYSDDRSQLICYKDKSDPVADRSLATIRWNDDSLAYPIISSIGADFDLGGYGLKDDQGWNGLKITAQDSPLLEGTGLQPGSIIPLPTGEYDGAPILWKQDGQPEVDIQAMGAYKAELIAYDFGFRNHSTVGTFFIMQKSPQSGIIVNAGSTHWCADTAMGEGAAKAVLEMVTFNTLRRLLWNAPVFSKQAIVGLND